MHCSEGRFALCHRVRPTKTYRCVRYKHHRTPIFRGKNGREPPEKVDRAWGWTGTQKNRHGAVERLTIRREPKEPTVTRPAHGKLRGGFHAAAMSFFVWSKGCRSCIALMFSWWLPVNLAA